LDAFYQRSNGSHRPTCKVCHRAHVKRNKTANIDAVREANRDYTNRWRAENPDEVKRRRGRYYYQDLEHSRALKTEGFNRRRARLLNAEHAPYSRTEIFARWDNLCCYCDAPAEHLDHVHALSKGGADAAHNLVPACAPCNLTKSDKSLADWASTF
jgi:5-methylcytosine-specific restriction endonuclease McrA